MNTDYLKISEELYERYGSSRPDAFLARELRPHSLLSWADLSTRGA